MSETTFPAKLQTIMFGNFVDYLVWMIWFFKSFNVLKISEREYQVAIVKV